MGVWKGIYLGLTGIEAQKEKEADREARRQEKLAELLETRRNTMLALGIKKKEQEASVNKYQKYLSWAESRLGDAEGSEEYLRTLRLDPSNAELAYNAITEAEKNSAKAGNPKRYVGEGFIGALSFIGENATNEEFLENFTSGKDLIDAALGGQDLGKDEVYTNLMEQAYQPRSTPAIAMDINSEALYTQPNIPISEFQNKLLDQTLISAANQELVRLSQSPEKDDNVVVELQDAISNYGKEGFVAETNALRAKFGPQVVATLDAASEQVPTLQGIRTNPYAILFSGGFQGQESTVPTNETPTAPQAPQVPQDGPYPEPTPAAVQALMKNFAGRRELFDQAFGPGAADRFMNDTIRPPRVD